MTSYAATPTIPAISPITTPVEFGDLELDTILKLKEVIYDQALIYANDIVEEVGKHLQQSFEDIKLIFFEFNEPDERTAPVFQTVWNLLFAA
jgi:hypothetical protein